MFHMEFPVKLPRKKVKHPMERRMNQSPHRNTLESSRFARQHLVRKTTGIIFVHLDDLDGHLNESGRPSGGMVSVESARVG